MLGPETRTCLLVGGRCSSLREDRPVEGLRDCPWGPPLLPCARCKDHFSLCSPPSLGQLTAPTPQGAWTFLKSFTENKGKQRRSRTNNARHTQDTHIPVTALPQPSLPLRLPDWPWASDQLGTGRAGLWFRGHGWEACLLGTHSKAPAPLPTRGPGQAASSQRKHQPMLGSREAGRPLTPSQAALARSPVNVTGEQHVADGLARGTSWPWPVWRAQ